ncbi:hypothetical protein NoPa_00163 [Pseudomonas phage vB_PpuM-NoPa]|uniref:Uncharacterized protein n=1 Tax=Pseudomonas phage vB_PpuM-NoPa TaxID=3132619 RepID=A0AAX4MZD9_9CAUD
MTTVNKIEVAEANPVQFLKRISEEIQNGFYVTTDIAGYPIQGLPFIITLSELEEAPEVKTPLGDEIHTAVVEGWNILDFLLDVQSAVLQGFSLDTERTVFGDFKSAVFTRKVGVKIDLNPKPKSETQASATEKVEDKPARKPRAKKGE